MRFVRLVSLLLIMCVFCQCTLPAFALGFMDNVSGGLSNAWSWTQDRAGDVADWVGDAADDVKEWAGDTAETVKDWGGETAEAVGEWVGSTTDNVTTWVTENGAVAVDWVADTASGAWTWTKGAANDAWGWTSDKATAAWGWTSDKASVAWDWTKGTANDAWTWTKGTAGDAWTWTCNTATNAWTVTSQKVSGTWNEIFGEKTEDENTPHHLCISSPLLVGSDTLGEWDDENGVITECLVYDDFYEIVLMSTAREEDILPPSVGDIEFADLVATNYETVTFAQDMAPGAGVRAMAQELRFKAIEDGEPVYGRALGVWTDHYIVAFIITTHVEINDENEIETDLSEVDSLYDLWLDTLSVYETKVEDIEIGGTSGNTSIVGGITTGNGIVSQRLYRETRFHARQGHGFAAERANNLADNIRGFFRGYRSRVTGDNNAKNGADREVSFLGGGKQLIQTKYCRTARDSINACFDDTGFRYFSDGMPMGIEVPFDQYDEAVDILRQYITDGRIQGVTDPDQAGTIVRRGKVTYEQARRIARPGNLDSLRYDAINGAIEGLTSMGISAAIEFGVCVWNKDDWDVALKKSVCTGLESMGTTFVISVVSSQLSKAGLASTINNVSEALVKRMGTKAAGAIANVFNSGSKVVGDAAISKVAGMLNNTIITSAVSIVVMSIPDVVDTFRGRISGKQLLKNVASISGGVVGGAVGWYGGAVLGTAVCPGVGTVIGSVIGGVAGGYIVQIATDTVADLIVEDDADEMLDIISEEFKVMAEEYLLSEEEINSITEMLIPILTADKLKDMFASSVRPVFAREVILRPIVESVVTNRVVIEIPTNDEYETMLIEVMEEIYDTEYTDEEEMVIE